jgi:hypothetical protein
MIKMIGPNVFLYIAADRESTNLAILRSVIAKHTPALR